MTKRIFFFLLILCIQTNIWAKPPFDEGMWLPIFLNELNYKDMKAKGLKLTAEQIYSVNKSSLKDAVVSFGGFCTGEMISAEGLLLTNHHCGYGSVQSHSSVENNYLEKGFWAMSKKDELPNEGLTATFIVRMEDVTKDILAGVTPQMDEAQRDQIINANIAKKSEEAIKGTHYTAVIKPFFYGLEYYMFVTETFKDVRLVGTPPNSIGKFGGDTDNWMWPRHTGDFSLFRVYAGKDGKPANYSPDNVPYKPRHFFPISLKGIKKEDFTMVMGFPGRTQEYLPSYAVKQLMEVADPKRIALREQVLKVMDAEMKTSEKVFIQYASKYARISNYYKKWSGELRGLQKLNAIEKKEDLERQFKDWVAKGDATRKQKYGTVLDDFKKVYDDIAQYEMPYMYWGEAVMTVDGMRNALVYERLLSSSANGLNKSQLEGIQSKVGEMYKDYNWAIDKKLFAICMTAYKNDVPKAFHPEFFNEVNSKFGGSFEKYADYVYEKSWMVSEEKATQLMKDFKADDLKKIEADPLRIALSQFVEIYNRNVQRQYQNQLGQVDLLQRTFIAGLREMLPNKKFYPDANSTLRITYGKIDDYEPRDAVKYTHQSFLEGIMEKEEPNNEEFVVPAKLKELYKKKDYGQYGENGKMPVAFTASNHTTGGNSGSPVIDAEGNLIGTNFDRNWEGTMSDVMYDPERVRNISVDIRYTLFIIDKFAGASHLIKELKLVK